jgi:hypothetical protein
MQQDQNQKQGDKSDEKKILECSKPFIKISKVNLLFLKIFFFLNFKIYFFILKFNFIILKGVTKKTISSI